MALKRFVFGYKGRFAVEQAEVEASSLEAAETVARSYCVSRGWRFLWVRDPVVCREAEATVVPSKKAS